MSIGNDISLNAHGEIIKLVLSGINVTRDSLIAKTGLARGTLKSRLASLIEAGLLRESSETRKTNAGRPPRMLKINPDFGYVLTIDIDQARIRTAVTDLKPSILVEEVLLGGLDETRSRTLTRIADSLDRCLARLHPDRPVLGIGICVPAPLHVGLEPSALPAWDDCDLAAWFEMRLRAPVFVDTDVNLLALAEHRTSWPSTNEFLFIKVGNTIGSGMMFHGQLYRGAQGSSGQIGHVHIRAAASTPCRCGKLGCLEAYASGWSIARELQAAGFEVNDARDVVSLVDAGVPQAIKLIERASMLLGEVIADLVSVLNPKVIVIGGTLSRAGPHILSGITETVQRGCFPMATRALRIVTSQSGHRHKIIGAAHFVIESRMYGSLTGRCRGDASTGGRSTARVGAPKSRGNRVNLFT